MLKGAVMHLLSDARKDSYNLGWEAGCIAGVTIGSIATTLFLVIASYLFR